MIILTPSVLDLEYSREWLSWPHLYYKIIFVVPDVTMLIVCSWFNSHMNARGWKELSIAITESWKGIQNNASMEQLPKEELYLNSVYDSVFSQIYNMKHVLCGVFFFLL